MALVSDIPGWAYHNTGKQIERVSNSEILFRNFTLHGNPVKKLAAGLAKEFDLIHFFWRLNCLEADLDPKFMTSAYYDHLYESDTRLNDHIFQSVSGIYTTTKKLHESYKNHSLKYPEVTYANCPDGVNLNFKVPDSQIAPDGEFRIIWVGNSAWGSNDHKGLHTVFYPALEIVSKISKIKITPIVIDAATKRISHSQVLAEYSKADLYVCTSLSEGTPNPLLEAMARGLPFVSTDVGLVKEVASINQARFICLRNPYDFAEKILEIINNPGIRMQCRRDNLKEIQKYSWPLKASKLRDFFLSTATNKN